MAAGGMGSDPSASGCDVFSFDGTEDVLKKVVPPKKASLTEINLKALRTGYDY